MDKNAGPIRAIRVIERVQLLIAMMAMAIMATTTVADVALRYGFSRPIRGAYDVVQVCLAIFVFNGAATVFFNRQNVVIDLVDHVIGAAAARVLVRVGEAIMIVVLLVIFYAMLSPAIQAYQYGDRELELNLPTFVVWIFVMVGMVGTLVCAIGGMLRPVELKHGDEP